MPCVDDVRTALLVELPSPVPTCANCVTVQLYAVRLALARSGDTIQMTLEAGRTRASPSALPPAPREPSRPCHSAVPHDIPQRDWAADAAYVQMSRRLDAQRN
eukprot:6526007-Prymnesium_polylepis.2